MRTSWFAVACLFSLLSFLFPAFASAAGRIEGVVSDLRTGQPVAGVTVELRYVLFGSWDPVASVPPVQTNAEGRYALESVPSGSGGVYALLASPPAPLLPLVWPDYRCTRAYACRPHWLAGNISVSEGSLLTLDFGLTSGGAIAGRVQRADNPQPIADQQVRAMWAGAGTGPGGEATSNAQGEYRIDGLPPGIYRVETLAGSFQPALHPAPVEVTADGLRAGVDFLLAPAPPPQIGSISGAVREVGMDHVSLGIEVSAHRFESGQWVRRGLANVSAGSSEFVLANLPAGDYVLKTSSSSGRLTYADEVFDDVDCAADQCIPAELNNGSQIALAADQAIAGIQIEVEPAASVSGCVRDAESLAPLPGVQVIVYKRSLSTFGYEFYTMADAVTGADGCYRMDYVQERPTATQWDSLARVRTRNSLGLIDQIYGGETCRPGECDLMNGLPVAIPHDADITNVDFALTEGPALKGRVLSTPEGRPLASVSLYLYNGDGVLVREGDGSFWEITQADGSFHTASLPAGTYFLVGSVESGPYAGRHLYGVPTRPGEPLPPVTSGTPLIITNDSAPPAFDFVLDPDGLLRDGFEAD